MRLKHSYAHCARVARQSGRNFYYSFLALPPAKRRAMCALYAFLRKTDDIGDGEGTLEERRQRLTAWRESLTRALAGHYDDPVFPALHETVCTYEIPHPCLYGVIDGVEMDLGTVQYQTFDELCVYCYRVASVVGLSCIHIWGFHGEEAESYACQSGIAFQLTNILRDLKEDAQRDRIYLPQDELQRFDYRAADLRAGCLDDRFRRLMRFQIERARDYYRRSAPLIDCLEPSGRPVFRTMRGIYAGILNEMERRDYDVFSRRVGLKPWHKVGILLRSFL